MYYLILANNFILEFLRLQFSPIFVIFLILWLKLASAFSDGSMNMK